LIRKFEAIFSENTWLRHDFRIKTWCLRYNGCDPSGMFVLHADALHSMPHDEHILGRTLGNVLTETANLTVVTPKRADVDKGYRGHPATDFADYARDVVATGGLIPTFGSHCYMSPTKCRNL
jgi:hypothetical protein